MKESTIQKLIRQAVNLDGRCRVTPCVGGVFRALHSEAHVRAGLGLGAADLPGVIRNHGPYHGRLFCIECKTFRKGSKQFDDQIAWMTACRANGGFYAVCRSVAEAMAAVERACRGELE